MYISWICSVIKGDNRKVLAVNCAISDGCLSKLLQLQLLFYVMAAGMASGSGRGFQLVWHLAADEVFSCYKRFHVLITLKTKVSLKRKNEYTIIKLKIKLKITQIIKTLNFFNMPCKC